MWEREREREREREIEHQMYVCEIAIAYVCYNSSLTMHLVEELV